MIKGSWKAMLVTGALCLAFAAPAAAKDPVRPIGGSFTTVDSFDLSHPGCWTVVGGTGRFEHATGSGVGHGFGITGSGSSTYRLSGTISY